MINWKGFQVNTVFGWWPVRSCFPFFSKNTYHSSIHSSIHSFIRCPEELHGFCWIWKLIFIFNISQLKICHYLLNCNLLQLHYVRCFNYNFILLCQSGRQAGQTGRVDLMKSQPGDMKSTRGCKWAMKVKYVCKRTIILSAFMDSVMADCGLWIITMDVYVLWALLWYINSWKAIYI